MRTKARWLCVSVCVCEQGYICILQLIHNIITQMPLPLIQHCSPRDDDKLHYLLTIGNLVLLHMYPSISLKQEKYFNKLYVCMCVSGHTLTLNHNYSKTSDKRTTSLQWTNCLPLPLTVHTFLPPNNGQNARPHCVHYSVYIYYNALFCPATSFSYILLHTHTNKHTHTHLPDVPSTSLATAQ